MIQLANLITHAVAAGIVAAGGSWDKKSAKASNRAYEQFIRGLMARAQGNVGKTHDIHGNPIVTDLYELRAWLVEAKVMAK